MQEAFNPTDEQYKKAEDLPEEEKDKFADVPEEQGGGFVRKETMETMRRATDLDPILYPETGMDALHAEAKRIENYTEEERLQNEIEECVKGCETLKDAPDELRDKPEFVLKFMECHSADNFKDVSNELKNDKDIILAFEGYTEVN